MESTSYVNMPSNQVQELATKCIRRIEAKRNVMIEAAVNAEQKRQRWWAESWFGRLFGLKVQSKDAIEQVIMRPRAPGDFWFNFRTEVLLTDWRAQDIANELLVASRHSSTVSVSTEDLWWIS